MAITIRRNKKFPLAQLNKAREVDYKDIDLLKIYIMESGRIIPSRITGATPKKQRQLTWAIKIARFLALLPYTERHKS
jgi:small subunit ribosomal protein S18